MNNWKIFWGVAENGDFGRHFDTIFHIICKAVLIGSCSSGVVLQKRRRRRLRLPPNCVGNKSKAAFFFFVKNVHWKNWPSEGQLSL